MVLFIFSMGMWLLEIPVRPQIASSLRQLLDTLRSWKHVTHSAGLERAESRAPHTGGYGLQWCLRSLSYGNIRAPNKLWKKIANGYGQTRVVHWNLLGFLRYRRLIAWFSYFLVWPYPSVSKIKALFLIDFVVLFISGN